MCFTNHALDSFLEDLIKVGIPASDIVRLGSKGTPQTLPLRVRDQPTGKLRQAQWAEITRLKLKLADHGDRLKDAFQTYHNANITKKQIMEFLEFVTEDLPFFETFTLPNDHEEGMTRVGARGKKVSQFYLLDRWLRGDQDAGAFRDAQPEDSLPVWGMMRGMRDACMQRWRHAILGDLIRAICESGKAFNADQTELTRIFAERDANVIKTKRIIGCTTNGAASYFSAIQAASPAVGMLLALPQPCHTIQSSYAYASRSSCRGGRRNPRIAHSDRSWATNTAADIDWGPQATSTKVLLATERGARRWLRPESIAF